jgi:polyribonucleotide nucleotidyltransferase
MGQRQLDLLMAGTAEAVLMIEGFCDWLTEEMLEARLGFIVLLFAAEVLQACHNMVIC